MYDWAEFRHFRYLLMILEKQGFRSAAEALYTSQPNLTVQARQFQDNAGIRLFRKSKDGRIRPTETGLAFITLARSLLDMREEVVDALIAIERGELEFVRFGCTPLVDQELFRSFCSLHKTILPSTVVRPTHGDAPQLGEEILDGAVDAAVITLPLKHPDLHVEELHRERLVVCLRKDHPLTAKALLQARDLQNNLSVLYHPQRHRDAHNRLVEMLSEANVVLDHYSNASHPSEMQMLVREGHGFALIREGAELDEELTIRAIAGVDWTVDTAVVYHKLRRPKTIPILVRNFKRRYAKELLTRKLNITSVVAQQADEVKASSPVQLSLLR